MRKLLRVYSITCNSGNAMDCLVHCTGNALLYVDVCHVFKLSRRRIIE